MRCLRLLRVLVNGKIEKCSFIVTTWRLSDTKGVEEADVILGWVEEKGEGMTRGGT